MQMQKTTAISVLSSLLAVGAIAGGAVEAGLLPCSWRTTIRQCKTSFFFKEPRISCRSNCHKVIEEKWVFIARTSQCFEQLQRNEKIKKVNPYFLTHPLSTERIKNIKLNTNNQNLKEYNRLNQEFKLIRQS